MSNVLKLKKLSKKSENTIKKIRERLNVYQSVSSKIIKDLKEVLCRIDEIIAHSSNNESDISKKIVNIATEQKTKIEKMINNENEKKQKLTELLYKLLEELKESKKNLDCELPLAAIVKNSSKKQIEDLLNEFNHLCTQVLTKDDKSDK